MKLFSKTRPEYTKVDLTQQPSDYWDYCRRCVTCGQKYPNHLAFTLSPCCDVTTAVKSDTPEHNWEESKRSLLRARFDKYYRHSYRGFGEEQQIWLGDSISLNEEELQEAFQEVLQEIEKLTSSTRPCLIK